MIEKFKSFKEANYRQLEIVSEKDFENDTNFKTRIIKPNFPLPDRLSSVVERLALNFSSIPTDGFLKN